MAIDFVFGFGTGYRATITGEHEQFWKVGYEGCNCCGVVGAVALSQRWY